MAEVVEDLEVVGADPITLVRRKGLPAIRQPLFFMPCDPKQGISTAPEHDV